MAYACMGMHARGCHVLLYSVTDRHNQIQAEDGSADCARASSPLDVRKTYSTKWHSPVQPDEDVCEQHTGKFSMPL